MTFTPARAAALPETKAESVVALESLWRVVLIDDPVNLMSYVVLVLRRVFGFDDERARRHMMETLEKGRSIVWVGPREKAEAYVYTLQEWHLSAILEKDETH
jgi:ATP-dependent Clp protease adaptor protein ClpS